MGERLNEVCDEAYMNGYNWEDLLGFWLEREHPALLEGSNSEPPPSPPQFPKTPPIRAPSLCAYYINSNGLGSSDPAVARIPGGAPTSCAGVWVLRFMVPR